MAKTEHAADAEGGAVDAGPQPSKLPLLIGLVNTIAVVAAIGMLIYTRILYKRPQITEEGERQKIEALKALPPPTTVPGYVNFEATTINISPSPVETKPSDGASNSQTVGKLHYATIGFSIELGDINRKDELEALKPLILDQFLALVGHKQFHELTSVQGRYVLKTQLIELANALAVKRSQLTPSQAEQAGPLITGLFFNQFIVQ
jgi:flagellar basal body-associated protein FliL